MTQRFSFLSLFSDFCSSGISSEELEKIISQTILDSFPGDKINDIQYHEDGVRVILNSGNVVDVDIDWNEIILL